MFRYETVPFGPDLSGPFAFLLIFYGLPIARSKQRLFIADILGDMVLLQLR